MEQNGYKLTEEQINFFHDKGYLHLKNVFTEEYCFKLIEDAEKKANGFYTSYLHFHLTGELKKLHTGKTMCDIADDLFNHRMIPCGSAFLFCKPNNPNEHGSIFHQDNFYVKAPYNAYLNLALALDDADESNGSLDVIPESHKFGDLPCENKSNFTKDQNGNLYQSAPIGNNCEVPKGLNLLNLNYKRGDVICIHAHIVHKANKNIHSSRWRRKIYLNYIKNEHPFWPGWNSQRKLLERYDSPNYNLED